MERKIDKPVDMFAYLMIKHPSEVIREGSSLKLKDKHYISLKQGWTGYNNFKGKGGNGLKLLVEYLGYTMEQAIEEMNKFEIPEGFYNSLGIKSGEKKAFVEPEHYVNNDKAISYLVEKRGIRSDIVQMLIGKGLIYQWQYNFCPNVVFLNAEKDYAEIHGTLNKHYTPKAEGSKEGGFWWFYPDDYWNISSPDNSHKPSKAYICEASIDAISLYQLLMERALYFSVGGCRCQIAIDQIKKFCHSADIEVILAVDNDEAGQMCRDNNTDLRYIIPKYKDWNEDLCNSSR